MNRPRFSQRTSLFDASEPPAHATPVQTWIDLTESNPTRVGLSPEVRGINIHAKQCVDGRDRKQLERLCRYITRPCLVRGEDGRYWRCQTRDGRGLGAHGKAQRRVSDCRRYLGEKREGTAE